MRDIFNLAKIHKAHCSIMLILCLFTHKQKDAFATFEMPNITEPFASICSRTVLRLPMKEAFTDCIVVVHRAGRKLLFTLIERHEKQFYVLVFKHHPMDRAYRNYGSLIGESTAERIKTNTASAVSDANRRGENK